MTKRVIMTEMNEAIDELLDWLDYDVFASHPELERLIKRIQHARMQQLLAEKRAVEYERDRNK